MQQMQSTAQTPSRTQSNHIYGWIVCCLAAVFYSYEFLLRVSPSVMVPDLRDFFHISATGLGALVGLYYMAYTPMQIIVGTILDYFGPRRVLTVAALLCTVGNFMFSIHQLALASTGRFLIGMGSAFAFVGTLKLAASWLPKKRFSLFVGITTSLAMVSGMISDVLLARLVQHVGWHNAMLIGTYTGAALIVLIWLVIRDEPDAGAGYSKISAHELFKGFVAVVTHSQIWLAGIIACMLYLSLTGFAELWGIPYLQTAYHFSADTAASVNSMVFFGWLVGCPIVGFAPWIKSRRLLMLSGSLVAFACISMILYFPGLTETSCGILLFLFGFSASTQIMCFTLGRDFSPDRVAATAVSFVNMLCMMGGFIFQPLIGKILDMVWQGGMMENGLRVYNAHEYRIALALLPCAMIISAIIAYIMREPPQVKAQ